MKSGSSILDRKLRGENGFGYANAYFEKRSGKLIPAL
jgi:hypothetical protein